MGRVEKVNRKSVKDLKTLDTHLRETNVLKDFNRNRMQILEVIGTEEAHDQKNFDYLMDLDTHKSKLTSIQNSPREEESKSESEVPRVSFHDPPESVNLPEQVQNQREILRNSK